MRKLFVVAITVIAFTLEGCNLLGVPKDKDLDAAKEEILLDVKYGSHSRNVMDVILPKNRTTNTPFVVFIHGGGWVSGDKGSLASLLKPYSDQGIACATINYRFASDADNAHHPDLPNDVVKALDYIVSKSSAWQVSAGRFGLAGASAGAHLAVITSYAFNNGRIKACASWAGPVDFIDSAQLAIPGIKDILKTYMGRPLVTAADTLAYKQASPYWQAKSTSVPTLLIHGTIDNVVAYNVSPQLKARLDSLGVQNNLIPLPGATHAWTTNEYIVAHNATLLWFIEKL